MASAEPHFKTTIKPTPATSKRAGNGISLQWALQLAESHADLDVLCDASAHPAEGFGGVLHVTGDQNCWGEKKSVEK